MPSIVLDIGGMPVRVRTGDSGFARMLEARYAGFVNPAADARGELEVDLAAPAAAAADAEVEVRRHGARWTLTRGDFRAHWDAEARRGTVRQSANPYAIDAVLRILHSLLLAKEGGLLVHAASAVRDGRAFVFAGVSGAGKTTIARLAPAGVRLLTDEISYLRRQGGGYVAYGTPFAGELAKVGENLQAPLAAVYLLAQGPENRVEEVEPAEAARSLLRHILFFAEDAELVKLVFQSACDLVGRVPVRRLTFLPDARVWGLIR